MNTYHEDPVDSDELLTRMRTLNKKFKNACSQVILLNNQIEYLQVRYDRAVKSNKRSYRYFLRLRLATLEGIRNMFYEYACRRADLLDEMQDQLVQEGIIDSDYDMDEDDPENDLYTIADTHVTTAQAMANSSHEPVYSVAQMHSVAIQNASPHPTNSYNSVSSGNHISNEIVDGSIPGFSDNSEVTVSESQDTVLVEGHVNIPVAENPEGNVVIEETTESEHHGSESLRENLVLNGNGFSTPLVTSNSAVSVNYDTETRIKQTVLSYKGDRVNTMLRQNDSGFNADQAGASNMFSNNYAGNSQKTKDTFLVVQPEEEYSVQVKAARIETEEKMQTDSM